uniref:Secreted protein n=1 Tax=Mesocestoides corti TaxID=53468 RepID=A0A5K3FKS4_MESCO
IPFPIIVCFWVAAYLSCIPLERNETKDWLRPTWSNRFAALDVAIVKYQSPNVQKTGTTEQALLTNQKPDPRIRRLP